MDTSNIKRCLPLPENIILSPYMAMYCILETREIMKRRIASLSKEYIKTNTALKKYVMRGKSNNWLKMHGYPMRRTK